MNIKHFLLVAVFALPLLSFAQPGNRGGAPGGGGNFEPSSLSVFSENGELFFLVLNGVNQNNQPVSKVRVEGLPKYGNDIQIMFSDSRFAPIRKTVNIADPVDAKAVNMTLKIARGHDGQLRLKFHSCSEVEHNYHGPRDEYVMNYGNPHQTNTTTETTYSDPQTGRTVTRTTTTVTKTNDNNYPPSPPARPQPMDPETFDELKKTVQNASFEDTKLSTAKAVLANNYVSTSQVMELCRMFSFEDSKLALAKFAYSRTVDQGSYFQVADLFSFDGTKNDFNKFLSNGGR